jgi:hypothetical protein
MGIITTEHSPGTRVETGNLILGRAKKANTKAIASRLARFKKAHGSYRAAERRVERAFAALRAQESRVGEADVEQDDSVFGLASCLAGDGLPRANPFRPLGEPAPSKVAKQGYGAEVATVKRIAKALAKRKDLSPRTKSAIEDALAAGAKVTKALAAIPSLEKAYGAAMKSRDALAQEWETSFAGIKLAARSAELDGAGGIVDALLKAPPKKESARAKKAASTRAANKAKKSATKTA